MKASGGGAPSPDPLGKGAATAPGPVWIINSSRQHATPPGEPREVQAVLTSPRICTQGLWRGLAGGGAATAATPLPSRGFGAGFISIPFGVRGTQWGRCPRGSRDMKRGGVSGVSAQQNTRSAYRRAGHQPAGPRRPGRAEGDANKEPEDEPSPSVPVGRVRLSCSGRTAVGSQPRAVGSVPGGKRGRRREGTPSFLQPAPATRLGEGLGGEIGVKQGGFSACHPPRQHVMGVGG